MTIKKSTVKNATVKTIGLTEQEILAQEVGNLVGQRDTINATMDIKCKQINKLRKGKPIGTQASDCAVMQSFLKSQIARGLSDNTIKNNCSTFRKAVNEGKPYDVNAHRKASASRGTKSRNDQPKMTAVKSDDKKPDVVISVRKGITSPELAKGLRNVFEQMRENHAELIAFITDSLNEYDGK